MKLPGAGTALVDGFTLSCESRAAGSVEGAVAVMLMRRAPIGVRTWVRRAQGEAAGRSMAVPVPVSVPVPVNWRGLLGGRFVKLEFGRHLDNCGALSAVRCKHGKRRRDVQPVLDDVFVPYPQLFTPTPTPSSRAAP